MLIDTVRKVLNERGASENEQNLIDEMQPSNVRISLQFYPDVLPSMRIVLSISTFMRLRMGTLLTFEGAMDVPIPSSIVAEAVNRLHVPEAHALADFLVDQTVRTPLDTQLSTGESLPTDDRSTAMHEYTDAFDASLREFHEAIRSGTLEMPFMDTNPNAEDANTL